MGARAVDTLAEAVPGWAGRVKSVEVLGGGITNRNFVAEVDGRRYVLRLPGERTELLGIDRTREADAARRAGDLGIGPPVVGTLPEVGTLIVELVDGVHLAPEEFVARLGEVVPLIRRLHRSGPIGGEFPIHRVVEWHARDAAAHGVPAPAVYDTLHRASLRIEAAFGRAPSAAVPCHNDLLPSNVLFGRDRVWLLDFEYAGMNDPSFDLGNVAVNCGLTPDAEHRLVEAYWGAWTEARWARLQLMKVMSEFREGMWAVVQQAISTLDEDFETYATERLGNCERLAESDDFGRWLDEAAGSVDDR